MPARMPAVMVTRSHEVSFTIYAISLKNSQRCSAETGRVSPFAILAAAMPAAAAITAPVAAPIPAAASAAWRRRQRNRGGLNDCAIRIHNAHRMRVLLPIPVDEKDIDALAKRPGGVHDPTIHQQFCSRLKIIAADADRRLPVGAR